MSVGAYELAGLVLLAIALLVTLCVLEHCSCLNGHEWRYFGPILRCRRCGRVSDES